MQGSSRIPVVVGEIMTGDLVGLDCRASLDDAIELMESEGVRHLPILEGRRLVGVLSERDVLEATGWLPPSLRGALEAPTGDVASSMSKPVVSASPEDTLVTACLRIVEWGVGCLPVLDNGFLAGMLSETDLLEAYGAACSGSLVAVDLDPRVEEAMTRDLTVADHRTPAEEALELLRSRGFRHLPVMADGELLGLVSDRDLRLSLGRGQLEGTPLSELFSPRLHSVTPTTRLSKVARVLVEEAIGALPVVAGEDEGGALLGLATTTDVLRCAAQAFAPDASPID